MILGVLALAVAAAFTGAAFYISVAEQPARLMLDDRAMLVHWKPAYARGYAMQATLAVLGFLLGIAAWWTTSDSMWLAGAVVLVANWPYTLLVILPVNNRLNAIDPDEAGPDSRELIERWGRMHARRTMLGAMASILFFWAACQPVGNL
jgi:ABC-type spermidine/putrescine transport system permease subunit I